MSVQLKIFVGISILFVLTAALIERFYCYKQQEFSTEYFRKLNLELHGRVSDKKELSHSAGILFVDVAYSSIPEYDTRNKKADGWSDVLPYYCVVKGRKAEIIEGGLSIINIGDSIVVSSTRNSFKIIRQDEVIVDHPLFLRETTIIDVQKLHLHKI